MFYLGRLLKSPVIRLGLPRPACRPTEKAWWHQSIHVNQPLFPRGASSHRWWFRFHEDRYGPGLCPCQNASQRSAADHCALEDPFEPAALRTRFPPHQSLWNRAREEQDCLLFFHISRSLSLTITATVICLFRASQIKTRLSFSLNGKSWANVFSMRDCFIAASQASERLRDDINSHSEVMQWLVWALS